MSTPLNVATPTDTSIVITRNFNAPRRLVWDAMTDPAKLRRWLFAPPGWTMTICEGEPRIGGEYKWAWKTAEADPAMVISGVFKEVVLHERIVHTEVMEMADMGVIGTLIATLELAEKNSVTTMHMTLEFDSKQARDGALASGMADGMEAGYTQLDAMLVQ